MIHILHCQTLVLRSQLTIVSIKASLWVLMIYILIYYYVCLRNLWLRIHQILIHHIQVGIKIIIRCVDRVARLWLVVRGEFIIYSGVLSVHGPGHVGCESRVVLLLLVFVSLLSIIVESFD